MSARQLGHPLINFHVLLADSAPLGSTLVLLNLCVLEKVKGALVHRYHYGAFQDSGGGGQSVLLQASLLVKYSVLILE